MIPGPNRPRARENWKSNCGFKGTYRGDQRFRLQKSKRGPRQALGQMGVWAHAIERKNDSGRKMIVE